MAPTSPTSTRPRPAWTSWRPDPSTKRPTNPAFAALFLAACAREACPDRRAPSGLAPLSADCTRFVSPDGEDGGAGTRESPWKTLGEAARQARAGDVVCAREGVYAEAVRVEVSGEAEAPIVFRSHPGEQAILDGAGLVVEDELALLHIEDQHHLVFAGFELRNLETRTRGAVPMGVLVTGAAHDITLRDNTLHDIAHTGRAAEGTDAHGIAVYGRSGETPIHDLVIDNNELYDLRLGSSEALVINGNVESWQITSNFIHDCDNIGIDAIGFEGTAPADDQAREGRIAGNAVCGIDTRDNPAYRGEQSAACIYVDGGARIVVEKNLAQRCNLGVEIASEHAGKSTSEVIVRDNFILENTHAAIALGGYDEARGSTERCAIVHNTTFQNDTSGSGSGELMFQYDTRDNVVANNLFVAGPQGLFISSWSPEMRGNAVDTNLYFTAGGGGAFEWQGEWFDGAAAYLAASGNDASSIFGEDPKFVDDAAPDLHLRSGSPAIDRGAPAEAASGEDIDGEARDAAPDLGADEAR